MTEPPIGELFRWRYWPDGPPTLPLPDPSEWEKLPTVTRLRSPAIASIKLNRSIWNVGWNGSWVKAFACAAKP
jgi:hypothetical protein